MNLLRKIIARFIELLAERLLRDMEQRLRPSFLALHARIDTLDRALVPPFPATVLNNEMRNLGSLPMPLLESLPELTVIGYYADDLRAILPTFRAAPFLDWVGAGEVIRAEPPSGNLLFLDEYYFMRVMARLVSQGFSIAESIIVATRFDYMAEARVRSLLHQLGFMEIVLVASDGLTGELASFAVSHASPVTCDPLFVDESRPPCGPADPTTWLVARKVAWYGAEGCPRA